MSNYARGANFEREVKKWYEDKGCFVIRSAGSHSPVDLVVFRSSQKTYRPGWKCENNPFFIQVKRDGKFSREERDKLIELANEYGATPLLAYRDKEEEGGIGIGIL